MYSLLIADDEAMERRALRFFLENSKLDIGEIYECANGNTTMNTIISRNPDIILMDIKMPSLNGLEVMEKINALNMNSKVIVSTAYDYFEYAVKALRLGAIDFLVKPVNKERLYSVLNKAIDQLDAQRFQKENEAQLKDLLAIVSKDILKDLIQGNIDEKTLYFLDMMGMDETSKGNCFFVRIENEMDESKQKQVKKTLSEDLCNLGYQCLLNIDNNYIIMVVFQLQPDSKHHSLDENVKRVLTGISRDIKTSFIVGAGLAFDDLLQIEQSFEFARSSFGDIVLSDGSRRKDIYPPVNERYEHRVSIPKEVNAVCMYIENNYEQKITLDDISDKVGYSKYYLTRLFKQYRHMSIIDYLIHIRMNKAKQLLLNGEYSIKQISRMVGYSDPNYFTWAFKKVEGKSPTKYRYSK